jgi:hypothetical protein
MLKRSVSIAACLFAMVAAGNIMAQQPLVMERQLITDRMAFNQDAATFLKPAGWKVSGGVKWYPNFAHLVCVEIKIANPDGLEQVEGLPWCYYMWSSDQIVPWVRGRNYAGRVFMPPVEDPKEFIRTITLPQLRGRDARIVGSQEMPEVAKAIKEDLKGMPFDSRVRSARVRVEYAVNGQAVEEDFYLSIVVNSTQVAGFNVESVGWGPVGNFSLRAAKGKLDAATPTLLAIANSLQATPKWFAEISYYRQVFQQNITEFAGAVSRMTRETNDEIGKKYSDQYWKQQASQDRLARQFSDSIRGVGRYESPYQSYPVQLPSGYRYAWGSSSGGYILSNDAGSDPNVGSTSTWQLLKPAD